VLSPRSAWLQKANRARLASNERSGFCVAPGGSLPSTRSLTFGLSFHALVDEEAVEIERGVRQEDPTPQGPDPVVQRPALGVAEPRLGLGEAFVEGRKFRRQVRTRPASLDQGEGLARQFEDLLEVAPGGRSGGSGAACRCQGEGQDGHPQPCR